MNSDAFLRISIHATRKDDGTWLGHCPSFPGIAIDGGTYEEALQNIEIKIRSRVDPTGMIGDRIEFNRASDDAYPFGTRKPSTTT